MKQEIELGALELSRALTLMPDETVRAMLKSFSAVEIQIVKEPETGLVMQSVSDCFQTDFHLGEILVTVAEVVIEGKRGWGMVMGDNGDRALLAACIEVILNGSESSLKDEVHGELLKWLTKSSDLVTEESRIYSTTQVNFESMAED